MNIAILLPTIYRKDGLRRALQSLFATTLNRRIGIIVAREYDDYDALDICKSYKGLVSSVICEKEKQGPAYAWNTALKYAPGYDSYFLASDDIEFLDGWLAEILKLEEIYQYHIGRPMGLIGVNDGTGKFERAGFCTHYFVTREFIRVHNGGVACCPAYFADFTDVEIIERARRVNEFAYAEHARIIHHWRETDDEAYRRGDERRTEARGIYLRRKANNFPNDFERIIE